MKEEENIFLKDYFIILLFPTIFMLIAIGGGNFTRTLEGFISIQSTRSILLVDYLELGGLEASLLNASIVTFLAIYLLYKSKKNIDGIAIASIYTILGFSFIGKNILNVLPIYLGGYLYARYAGEDMKDCIIALIFGTTLAPIITEISFHMGLTTGLGLILGSGLGLIIGFILNPVGRQMVKFHEGYNLYNIGFTGGVIGTFVIAILRSFNIDIETQMIISVDYSRHLFFILAVLFIVLIYLGLSLDRDSKKKYISLLENSGLAPNSFVDLYGRPSTYINMGIMGLIGIFYVFISKSHIHGPALAGILTITGFAASGKHPKNTLPILLGVFLTVHLNTMDPSSPSVLIGGLFATTLGPLTGEFGPLAGLIAGFLHISLGSNILNNHGGINLYNNGFAGGIVAAFMLPLCRLLKSRDL